MNQAVNASRYDLFKAIIALILLMILIWLFLNGTGQPAPALSVPLLTNEVDLSLGQATASPPSSVSSSNPTPNSETAETEISIPSAPAAVAATAPASTLPTSTPEPTSGPSPTETAPVAADQHQVDCPLALATRLKVGERAVVVTNLNMRTEAGITKKLIRTNPAGTELTIIGGPVCEAYEAGAYLWWQVQRADEENGWSAEGSLTDQFYFLEPVG